ncbi:type IV pilin N-terminal domain-containing protein [Haloarcula salinisoli]|uniref:Type IV pilin N-terminal domain-containing protein n=1 Tax=Haloarcula salinisoli TaxID=2487746 RepID=A0A8J7YJH4_9EURY|nr:type IV pilin N-terminal domain-containing protein [Halomicroarcula salinisoli]MBX0287153.1 type IV pilin N-terminal domain-containing protein [Halomicroarcula salinisoli]MBX0304456.1 type IV pilin N-terminal domain-containing protein [Halomicroarcula salinisoli]
MGFREQWAELGTGVKVIIGLVLLVGLIPLLVILAAIVASFVLGFGSGGEAAAAPQASWGYEYNETNESSGKLTIIHEGGDSIEVSKLTVEVGSDTVDWDADSERISVGDSTTVEAGPDEVVRVVWRSGGEETIIGEWDGQGY